MNNLLGEYSQEEGSEGSRIEQGRKLSKDMALSGVELPLDPIKSPGS